MNIARASLLSVFLSASIPAHAGFVSVFDFDPITLEPKGPGWEVNPKKYHELDVEYGPLYYVAVDTDPIDNVDFQQARIMIAGYDKNESFIHCIDSISLYAWQTSGNPIFSGEPAFALTVQENKPIRALFHKDQCQRMNGSVHEAVFKPLEIMDRIHEKEEQSRELFNRLQKMIEERRAETLSHD